MNLHGREDAKGTDRRCFVAGAALAMASWSMARRAAAQAVSTGAAGEPAARPRTHGSFGPLKQLDAGILRVGYAEAGPAAGPPVLLLHGWPYDIHSYVDVAPLLAAKGYRVIVPFLRGYGTTRFLSDKSPRNAQQAVA